MAASALALAVAPLVVAPGYSWIRHSVSESGAQGVQGAWVARPGFVLFGIAVWRLAESSRSRWGGWTTLFFRSFALAMFGVAAFSHRPWRSAAPFDPTEDLLHSIAATAMGFAIILGTSTRLLARPHHESKAKAFNAALVVVGTAAPLAMLARPDVAGLLQRVMFAAAYLWFARETLTSGDNGRYS